VADNYVQFSEGLVIQTDEEEAWLRRLFEEGKFFNHEEDVDKYEEFLRLWGISHISESAMYSWPGFGYEFEGDSTGSRTRYLWIWDGGMYGDVESAAAIIQAFIRKFRPDSVFRLTWAASCSKPRIGEFFGGAVVISSSVIKWFNAEGVAAGYTRKYHKGKSPLNYA
jgi:hypothetical protein